MEKILEPLDKLDNNTRYIFQDEEATFKIIKNKEKIDNFMVEITEEIFNYYMSKYALSKNGFDNRFFLIVDENCELVFVNIEHPIYKKLRKERLVKPSKLEVGELYVVSDYEYNIYLGKFKYSYGDGSNNFEHLFFNISTEKETYSYVNDQDFPYMETDGNIYKQLPESFKKFKSKEVCLKFVRAFDTSFVL